MYALSPTPREWAQTAVSDLPALLADHLHCERKAAATALSLVRSYPEREELVLHLSRLAHEETSHLMAVHRELRQRGETARRDAGDPYARALRDEVRRTEPQRQLDLLLVSGLIEARSAERLGLVAGALEASEPELARFYAELTRSEERHRDLFASLALPLRPEPEVRERAAALCAREAQLVASLPWGSRIH